MDDVDGAAVDPPNPNPPDAGAAAVELVPPKDSPPAEAGEAAAPVDPPKLNPPPVPEADAGVDPKLNPPDGAAAEEVDCPAVDPNAFAGWDGVVPPPKEKPGPLLLLWPLVEPAPNEKPPAAGAAGVAAPKANDIDPLLKRCH